MNFKVTKIAEEVVEANNIDEARKMYPNDRVEEINEGNGLDLSEAFESFKKAKEKINIEIQKVKDLENELHNKEAKKFKEICDYLCNEVEPIIKKLRKDFLLFGFEGKNYIIKHHTMNYGVNFYKGNLIGECNDNYSCSLVDECGNFFLADFEKDRYSDYGVKKFFVRNWDKAKIAISKELILRMQKDLTDIKAENNENRETVLKLLNK